MGNIPIRNVYSFTLCKHNYQLNFRCYSGLYRFLHWPIVTEVLLLLLSGLGVSTYIPFELLGRGSARSLHILTGFVWAGTIGFFIYYFVVSGEYKWFCVSKIGSAFDYLVHEVACVIGGKKIDSSVGYGLEKKKYVEKVVPTEVLAWWGWLALWTLMALTGLALLFPEALGLVNRLCHALLPSFRHATAATRVVHLALSLVIIVYMLMHACASWMFGMVGSMFTGNKEEPVVPSVKPL